MRSRKELYRTKRGELFLPTRTILGAIVKAGRDQHPDMFWPRAVNVVETWPRIACTHARRSLPLADWTIERLAERFDGLRIGAFTRDSMRRDFDLHCPSTKKVVR